MNPNMQPYYLPPRRKPVPSRTEAPPQHSPHFEAQSPSTPSSGSMPPQSPSVPINTEQYQHQYQYQYAHQPQHGNFPGYREQPQSTPRQPTKLSACLKPLGSLLKDALKATIDPSNIYSNNSGQQYPSFGQQQQHGPGQASQIPTHGHMNGSGSPINQQNGATIVNGKALDSAAISRLHMSGIVPMPGRYWYDNRAGAWGLESGPCIGILPPNLSLGGPLAADASGPSGTGVFINGRQIHASDVGQFRAMGHNVHSRQMVGQF